MIVAVQPSRVFFVSVTRISRRLSLVRLRDFVAWHVNAYHDVVKAHLLHQLQLKVLMFHAIKFICRRCNEEWLTHCITIIAIMVMAESASASGHRL
jgi:hypothetical protein